MSLAIQNCFTPRLQSAQSTPLDPRRQPSPGVTMMQIDQQLAQEWLVSNIENRNLRKTQVEHLAKQMMSGEYVSGAAVVAFSTNGRLLNGQHTLNAIISSGTTQIVTVQYGMPESAFGAYDTGLTRKLSDVTKLGTKKIAILNCINNAGKGNCHGKYKLTPTEALALLSKCNEGFSILESINNWSSLLNPSMIPAAFIASFYLFPKSRDWHVIILKWLADDADINKSMLRPPVIGAWSVSCKKLKDRFSGGETARLDVFHRMMRVFDPECKNNTKIFPANPQLIRQKIMQVFFPEWV